MSPFPDFQRLTPTAAPMLAGLHAESFGTDSWSIDQLEGSLMLATTQGWVALVTQQPAGFILCQSAATEAEVLTFCVRPAFRRQGVGKHLLRQALQNLMLPSGAAQILHLEVAADNHGARALYEACGFTQIAVRRNYYRRGALMVDGVSYACRAPQS